MGERNEDDEFIFSHMGLEMATGHLSGNLYLAAVEK